MSGDPILAALERLEAGQTHLNMYVTALSNAITRFEAWHEGFADRLDRFAHEQQRHGGVLDRLEGKVDKLAADVAHLGPRVSQMETDFGGQYVRAGTANNRLDDLAVRVALIERRLELRDAAGPGA